MVYTTGSQSGVWGPPGVLEGVAGGPQLNDSQEPNGPLWICNSESLQMHLYTSQSEINIDITIKLRDGGL